MIKRGGKGGRRGSVKEIKKLGEGRRSKGTNDKARRKWRKEQME